MTNLNEQLRAALRSAVLAQGSYGPKYDGAKLACAIEEIIATPAPQAAPSDDALTKAFETALELAAQACDIKHRARVTSGHPREASTARALAEEIRSLAAAPASLTPAPQATASELIDAVAAIQRAKKLPVWDAIDYRLHVELDTIFKALSAASLTQAATSDDVAAKLAAIVTWLETNQPDVFRRGLWESITAASAQAATSEPVPTDLDGEPGGFKIEFCGHAGKERYRIYNVDGYSICYAQNKHQADHVLNLLTAAVAAPVAAQQTTDARDAKPLPSVTTWQERIAHHPDRTAAEYVDEAKDSEIADLRAALSAQQAGVQEAPIEGAKDAARYRWLRKAATFGGNQQYDLRWYLPRGLEGDRREQLDTAIDIAIERAALAAATQTEKK